MRPLSACTRPSPISPVTLPSPSKRLSRSHRSSEPLPWSSHLEPGWESFHCCSLPVVSRFRLSGQRRDLQTVSSSDVLFTVNGVILSLSKDRRQCFCARHPYNQLWKSCRTGLSPGSKTT